MLARLIASRQVVILCDNSRAYLFFDSHVYSQLMNNDPFWNLPKHKTMTYCPIMALINVDYKDQGPSITGESNIWPIQASSPNPIRWKSWAKQNKAAVVGMPHWTTDELAEGAPMPPLTSIPAMLLRR